MALYKKFNPFKRKVFKFFTSFLNNSKNLDALSGVEKSSITRILIVRPNHRLGNQLLLSPLLQELINTFPNAKIDFVVNGTLANVLFVNYASLGKVYGLPKKPFKNLLKYISVCFSLIFSKYDISIAGDEKSNSSKIFVKLPRAKFKIMNSGGYEKKSLHIAKKPIENLRYFLNEKSATLSNEYPKLNVKLNPTEIKAGKGIVRNYFNNDQLTIGVFTNATGRKKLSKEWWHKFTHELNETLPDVNILEILPKENTSQLDFKHTCYYSKDLREIAAVIESCVVFVGADSGMMHLSAATNTATFGLFNGATRLEVYGPYGKDSYIVDTNALTVKQLSDNIKNIITT